MKDKPFNGYPNSATWCAALYLGNEPSAQKKAEELFKLGKLDARAIKTMFFNLGLTLDDWAEGAVDWEFILPEVVEPIKDKLADEPIIPMPTDVLTVLSQCICDGFTVKLPCQLQRNLYTKVASILKDLGGPWNKKAGGHVFKEDPAELLDDIMVTGRVKKPEKYGYFPTPRTLGVHAVEKADIRMGMTVLEPEAGSADLADVIAEKTSIEKILCCELQAKNVEILTQKGYQVKSGDFLSMDLACQFDRVVMNPPFERQADIQHVLHAWHFVKPGGRLVSIMSASVLFRQDRKASEFRDFVELYVGEITENPEGSFKSSGTSVNTVTLVMDKPTDCNSIYKDYSQEVIFEPPPVIEPPVLSVVAAIKSPIIEQLSLFG